LEEFLKKKKHKALMVAVAKSKKGVVAPSLEVFHRQWLQNITRNVINAIDEK
jgi:hypothetical protein